MGVWVEKDKGRGWEGNRCDRKGMGWIERRKEKGDDGKRRGLGSVLKKERKE